MCETNNHLLAPGPGGSISLSSVGEKWCCLLSWWWSDNEKSVRVSKTINSFSTTHQAAKIIQDRCHQWSTRPDSTVSPVATIVFCFVLLDLKSGDGRTDNNDHYGRDCGWSSGSISSSYRWKVIVSIIIGFLLFSLGCQIIIQLQFVVTALKKINFSPVSIAIKVSKM